MYAPLSGSPAGKSRLAFSLVELMVASAVVVLLLVILLQMTNSTASIWRRTTSKAEQFRAAREGFEAINRKLSQATLNTYWDYDNDNAPSRFIRQSELRFICGPMSTGANALAPAPAPPRKWVTDGVFFHAPLGKGTASNDQGLPNMLNTCGYYVEYNDDSNSQPIFLQNVIPLRSRFRLMEMTVPSENVETYAKTSGGTGAPLNLTYTGRQWFTDFLTGAAEQSGKVRVLAENVVALVILPRLSTQDEQRRAASNLKPLSPDYYYDSTYFPNPTDARYQDPETNPINQLPPVVQVTMVAIDEISAERLADASGTSMPVLDPTGMLFSDSRLLFDGPSAPGGGDLSKFEANLVAKHLSYRVFTAAVAIRGAKWSRQQIK